MKNIVKIGAALTALLIATSNAFAGWGGVVQDLTISNNLNATTTTLSGYPTNGATTGTNGLYIATGGTANLSQQDSFNFQISGFINSTNAATGGMTVTCTLIGANAATGGPVATPGTNIYLAGITNTVYTDFQTGTLPAAQSLIFTIPTGYTNGYVSFQTNFPSSSFLAQCLWVGLTNVTIANFGTAGVITNLDAKIISKQSIHPFSN